VRALEQTLADGRDEIVERIAGQLGAYRPCASTALGPAGISSLVSALVDGFIESARTRRVAPFVDGVRAAAAGGRGAERLPGAEMHTILDLLQDLAADSVAAQSGGRPVPDQLAVIRSLVDAARDAVPRDSRLDPPPK
jgi:hypothetical protein